MLLKLDSWALPEPFLFVDSCSIINLCAVTETEASNSNPSWWHHCLHFHLWCHIFKFPRKQALWRWKLFLKHTHTYTHLKSLDFIQETFIQENLVKLIKNGESTIPSAQLSVTQTSPQIKPRTQGSFLLPAPSSHWEDMLSLWEEQASSMSYLPPNYLLQWLNNRWVWLRSQGYLLPSTHS